MTKADIQLVRALADKRGRTEHGLFVAEGEKLIGELRTSHLGVRKIFALEGLFSGPEVEVVGTKEMERLSLLKTASNSLALVEIPHYGLDMRALAGRLTLALDDVQNPGNLGTIVRLADWFGITDIVCSEASADCFNPKVVQATMGAIHRPGRVPAPSRGRRAAGVRDFPGGGEHLRGVAPGGRDRRHGQRGARHFGRRGRDRHPQIVHPALPGRPAGFGIAQRGDGDGDRLRRIPAAGKHDGHGTGVKEQKTEGRSRKQTRAIPVITQTTGKT